MRSSWDGRSRRPLRVGLAALAAISLIALASQISGQHAAELAQQQGAPSWLLGLGHHAAILGAVVLAGLVAAALLALDRAPIRSALALLASLALLAECQAALLGGPHRSWFAVGAMLLGWSMGLAWGRGLVPRRSDFDRSAPVLDAHGFVAPPRNTSSIPSSSRLALCAESSADTSQNHCGEVLRARSREDLAEAGAVAMLAATYVSAGLSKLLAQGLSWTDPAHLSGTILSLHQVDDAGWRSACVRLVVGHPALARGLLAATLAIQLGAFAYPLHPTLRAVWGTLLIGFHTQVWLLTGIAYSENLWLLLLFSYPWSRLAAKAPAPAAVDPAVARRVLVAALVIAATCVALAWLLPIRAYTHGQD